MTKQVRDRSRFRPDDSRRLALNPQELASRLGITRPLIDRGIRDGTIRAIRVGRRVLVPMNEVERILNSDLHINPLTQGTFDNE